MFGSVVFYTVLNASFRTAYLKIGGRVITASGTERQRDQRACGITPTPPSREHYGPSSPAKAWWAMVVAPS